MNQDQQTQSTRQAEPADIPASEDAVLHLTTRLIAAVVRRTFGDDAGFVWAVAVPHGSDPALHRYHATTTLSLPHAAHLMRAVANAALQSECLDVAPTDVVHVCAATFREFDPSQPT